MSAEMVKLEHFQKLIQKLFNDIHKDPGRLKKNSHENKNKKSHDNKKTPACQIRNTVQEAGVDVSVTTICRTTEAILQDANH
uniref:Uncharacterized protein n=1 Tax=Anguilla anguilla TaxID=7936 RepID=A0A0E9WXK4_ANGAN